MPEQRCPSRSSESSDGTAGTRSEEVPICAQVASAPGRSGRTFGARSGDGARVSGSRAVPVAIAVVEVLS
jgi:hypothetical protein